MYQQNKDEYNSSLTGNYEYMHIHVYEVILYLKRSTCQRIFRHPRIQHVLSVSSSSSLSHIRWKEEKAIWSGDGANECMDV